MTIIHQQQDFTREQVVNSTPDRVLEAFTTLHGLAGWWTSTVSGDPAPGGEITFVFDGQDRSQTKVMRVDEVTSDGVVWTCSSDSGHREWAGTRIVIRLEQRDDGRTLMRFRHEGLVPELECYEQCEAGWDYFMPSIAAWAESGRGNPWSPDVKRT